MLKPNHDSYRWIRLVLGSILAAAALAIGAAPAHAQSSAETLQASVIVNGAPAIAGLHITLSTVGPTPAATTTTAPTTEPPAQPDCSASLTNQAARALLETGACPKDVPLFAYLRANAEAEKSFPATASVTLPTEGIISIEFEVNPDTATQLGLVADTSATAAEAAVASQSQVFDNVFEDVRGIMIGLLATGFGLLAGLGFAMVLINRRRYQFLTETFEAVPKDDADILKLWHEAMDTESDQASERFKVFRWIVEGLVLSFVVIAIISLGSAGKIEAQGMVSVLAAIVGYAAGRATS